MLVTELSSSSTGDLADLVLRSVARQLTCGLAARPPDTVLEPGAPSVALLRRTDLLIIASAVPEGPVHSGLLDALAEDGVLAGCVVFLAAVGPWPAEVGTIDRTLLPLVLRAGGLSMAPALHVIDDAPAPIDAYCRYWRPMVGAMLLRSGRRTIAV